MKCPVCDVPLSISSREGVEIDFCPQCRGVWLDRGELDKVIERAAASLAPTAPVSSSGSSPARLARLYSAATRSGSRAANVRSISLARLAVSHTANTPASSRSPVVASRSRTGPGRSPSSSSR
ncbi:MAG: zf-TFIIB domain-containing protein [Acidimicrobiales bacterium]